MENKQAKTPFFSGLQHYIASKPIAFHVPGHKCGKAMDPEFRDFIGIASLSLDLTNISPADDLHNPRNIIKEAQELAAEAFGADFTWFSVQGTSTPIMAMILAVCNPGNKIILPRNIHKSVLSGLLLSGAQPIFIHPKIDTQLGIVHCITASQVHQALKNHPDAKAVLVINPTYYGFVSNLQEIVQITHSHNIPVLVDEAHGSHIHFHEKMPLSAMEAGADLATTSVHKLGGSLTQSSILNLKGNRVPPDRIQATLNMLTTTSASCLLLASLDTARRHLAIHGRKNVEEAIRLANQARKRINTIPGLYCPGSELLGKTDAIYDYDPTKLVISVKNLALSGIGAEIWLRYHHQIQVEMSDINNILCIVTGGDDQNSINQLINALQALSLHFTPLSYKVKLGETPLPPRPNLVTLPREAFYSTSTQVPLLNAINRIVSEWIMVYPPGIPLILPGERLDEATLAYIIHSRYIGLTILGTKDKSLKTIGII